MTKEEAAKILNCSTHTPCEEVYVSYNRERWSILANEYPDPNALAQLDTAFRALCPRYQPDPIPPPHFYPRLPWLKTLFEMINKISKLLISGFNKIVITIKEGISRIYNRIRHPRDTFGTSSLKLLKPVLEMTKKISRLPVKGSHSIFIKMKKGISLVQNPIRFSSPKNLSNFLRALRLVLLSISALVLLVVGLLYVKDPHVKDPPSLHNNPHLQRPFEWVLGYKDGVPLDSIFTHMYDWGKNQLFENMLDQTRQRILDKWNLPTERQLGSLWENLDPKYKGAFIEFWEKAVSEFDSPNRFIQNGWDEENRKEFQKFKKRLNSLKISD